MSRHPRGLGALFCTEMWERFSYYGMRALLVLYMTTPARDGGLGMDIPSATGVYGIYTSSVYVTSPLGGLIADRLLGARRAVIAGGVLITVGQLLLTLPTLAAFYAGLGSIALGTGLLKPNVSALVGSLYRADDPRRDSGFSIFYIGINVGAMLAPLVCGALAQGLGSWRLGFAAAGVGMVLGLVQFIWQFEEERTATQPPVREAAAADDRAPARFGVIALLCLCAVVFFAAFEQSGSSLTLFADRLTRHEILGWEFPSSWFQSVNSVFLLLLAPLFSWLWIVWGTRAPRSPMKFALGLAFVGLGFLLMVPTAFASGRGAVSPLWLIGMYLLHTIGELCLSPVGLSTISKLAPARSAGLTLGIWFVAIALGNLASGGVARWFDPAQPTSGVWLFGGLAALGLGGGAAMALAARSISARMGCVR